MCALDANTCFTTIRLWLSNFQLKNYLPWWPLRWGPDHETVSSYVPQHTPLPLPYTITVGGRVKFIKYNNFFGWLQYVLYEDFTLFSFGITDNIGLIGLFSGLYKTMYIRYFFGQQTSKIILKGQIFLLDVSKVKNIKCSIWIKSIEYKLSSLT